RSAGYVGHPTKLFAASIVLPTEVPDTNAGCDRIPKEQSAIRASMAASTRIQAGRLLAPLDPGHRIFPRSALPLSGPARSPGSGRRAAGRNHRARRRPRYRPAFMERARPAHAKTGRNNRLGAANVLLHRGFPSGARKTSYGAAGTG